jgi:hypothetical protein
MRKILHVRHHMLSLPLALVRAQGLPNRRS